MGVCISKKRSRRQKSQLICDSSKDPFTNVSSSHHDLILQHLRGTEVLQASEVSKSWNQIIGASCKAMEKIKLKIIDCETGDCEAEDEAKAMTTGKQVLDVVLQSSRSYKNLFVCSQNKKNIIEKFSESLEEITVNNYDTTAYKIELLNLKKLLINGDAMSEGLINCPANLEELKIQSIRTSAVESVISCLKKNEKLNKLALGASASVIFKKDLSSTFKFQLKSLQVKLYFIVNRGPFYRFLISQAQSLQELTVHITQCDSSIMNISINNLIKLKKLRIFSASEVYGIENSPPHELPAGLALKTNSMIKQLHIERLCLKDLNLLKILLDSLPNLETFLVLDSTKDALIFTIGNARKLKKFQTLLINLSIDNVAT